jgi:hypothetical protein
METHNDCNLTSSSAGLGTGVSFKSHRFSQSTFGQSEHACSSRSEKENWPCSISRSIVSCGAAIW